MEKNELTLDVFRSNLIQLLMEKPRLLILGVGENRMGDDGIGPWITYQLYRQSKFLEIKVMNTGIHPDRRRDEMKEFHPDLILIIDAISTVSPPGTIGFYPENKMLNILPISSHTLPLPVFINRIKIDLPQVKIVLLGITPFHVEFESAFHIFEDGNIQVDEFEKDQNIPFYRFNLSPEIEQIGKLIIDMFIEAIKYLYKSI